MIPSPIASHAPSRNSLCMDTRKGAVKASWKECGKECVKDNYFADSFQHFFKDVLQGATPDVRPDTSRETTYQVWEKVTQAGKAEAKNVGGMRKGMSGGEFLCRSLPVFPDKNSSRMNFQMFNQLGKDRRRNVGRNERRPSPSPLPSRTLPGMLAGWISRCLSR